MPGHKVSFLESFFVPQAGENCRSKAPGQVWELPAGLEDFAGPRWQQHVQLGLGLTGQSSISNRANSLTGGGQSKATFCLNNHGKLHNWWGARYLTNLGKPHRGS